MKDIMQNNNVFPVLYSFILFHIQTFSLLLVHYVKGLLTCNSCTQSSSNLTIVYSNYTGNKSHIVFCWYHSAELFSFSQNQNSILIGKDWQSLCLEMREEQN